MRECLLPGCGKAFQPAKSWQRFCSVQCSSRDRQRRLRERQRKLKALGGDQAGQVITGLGRRKIVKRGSKDISAREAAILTKLRRADPETHSAVESMLEDTPRNRSSTSTTTPLATPVAVDRAPQTPNRRMRGVTRVHPRSLERI